MSRRRNPGLGIRLPWEDDTWGGSAIRTWEPTGWWGGEYAIYPEGAIGDPLWPREIKAGSRWKAALHPYAGYGRSLGVFDTDSEAADAVLAEVARLYAKELTDPHSQFDFEVKRDFHSLPEALQVALDVELSKSNPKRARRNTKKRDPETGKKVRKKRKKKTKLPRRLLPSPKASTGKGRLPWERVKNPLTGEMDWYWDAADLPLISTQFYIEYHPEVFQRGAHRYDIKRGKPYWIAQNQPRLVRYLGRPELGGRRRVRREEQRWSAGPYTGHFATFEEAEDAVLDHVLRRHQQRPPTSHLKKRIPTTRETEFLLSRFLHAQRLQPAFVRNLVEDWVVGEMARNLQQGTLVGKMLAKELPKLSPSVQVHLDVAFSRVA